MDAADQAAPAFAVVGFGRMQPGAAPAGWTRGLTGRRGAWTKAGSVTPFDDFRFGAP